MIINFSILNCQTPAGDYEIFNLIRNSDGTSSFESMQFPGNYLRMDGDKNPKFNPGGFGTVNCQGSIGSWEKFNINVLEENEQDGVISSIESNHFSSNYLRLSGGDNPQHNPAGFGTINCQASVGSWEKFHLGGTLHKSLNHLSTTFPKLASISEQEKIVEAFIKDTHVSALQFDLSDCIQLTVEEREQIEKLDLSTITPCMQSVANLCVDTFLFGLTLVGVSISKNDTMVKAAINELSGKDITPLEKAIVAASKATGIKNKSVLIFNIFRQILDLGLIRVLLKTLGDIFHWWTVVKIAVGFTAQLLAWVATDGIAAIAQMILKAVAVESIIEDAVKVKTKCMS